MCGRTAQTGAAVRAAAEMLNVTLPLETAAPKTSESSSPTRSERSNSENEDRLMRDNYNMSPGMDALVFVLDSNDQIKAERKVWGLVTRGGTPSNPLPSGMGQHFSNLMFNARSDTMYQKPSFSRLANARKSCLVAFDGFYEWKTELGKKQPYFVYRKKSPNESADNKLPFLLMPGLWTSVQTGRETDPVLDTFTLITGDVCPSLKWLHTRMPVCLWDMNLAKEWLRSPSHKTFKKIEAQASAMEQFAWHAVTPDMSSVKYRSQDALKALPKMKTVDSFFRKQTNTGAGVKTTNQEKKRADEVREIHVQSSKKPRTSLTTTPLPATPKKGSILNFFSPKPKT
jgi:putative SOS response-associated peptidase YedK